MDLNTAADAYKKKWKKNAFSTITVLVDLGDEALMKFLTLAIVGRAQAVSIFLADSYCVIERRKAANLQPPKSAPHRNKGHWGRKLCLFRPGNEKFTRRGNSPV